MLVPTLVSLLNGYTHAQMMTLVGPAFTIALSGGVESLRSAVVVAGMVLALTLLLITIFVGEFRGPRSDVAVLLITFARTVLVDLTVAIGVGMVLASCLLMRRTSELSDLTAITPEDLDGDELNGDKADTRVTALPEEVQVYAIHAPFCFGAADRFKAALSEVGSRPKVRILRLRDVPVIDSTGLRALADLVSRGKKDGTRVLLAEVQEKVRAVVVRSRLGDLLGRREITETLEAAFAQVRGVSGSEGFQRTAEHQTGRRESDRSWRQRDA